MRALCPTLVLLVAAPLPLLGQSMAASPVTASNPNLREGFWVGFGLGYGGAGVDCRDCFNTSESGFSGYVRLGGTLSQHFLLGAETNGWIHSDGSDDEKLGFLTGNLYWYPSHTGAFYLKAGLGAMRYTDDTGFDQFESTGAAGSFGLGYEFRVKPKLSIAVFVNSLAAVNPRLKLNGVSLAANEDFTVRLIQAGIGLTWH